MTTRQALETIDGGDAIGETAVETDGLGKRYGATLALDGLSLRVERGQIFGIVGPDGAGKSTTLRLLTATVAPSAGSARVAGFDVVRQPERVRERVGYVAQHFALYGDLTVAENLEFYADVFGVPKAVRAERTVRLLAFSRLTEHSDRLADRLSGGMKRKLALACALIHRPEVLFLDEPTAGVDPLSRRDLWRILGGLLREGLTIVLTTAYMDEAERCTRLGFLAEGRLVATGTPDELRQLVGNQVYEVTGCSLPAARTIAEMTWGVEAVQILGDRLHVFGQPDAGLATELVARLESAGLTGSVVRQVEPSMEDVFIALRRRVPPAGSTR
jgi:ABC-2 type transport system ATP-binding protein